NGPSHSTLMPSLASSLLNSPRSLATRLRPLRPQVSRTRSVGRPFADQALWPKSRPARPPAPNVAAPKKRRRDDEKSDITWILAFIAFSSEVVTGSREENASSRKLSGGVRRHAQFGQKVGARDCRRTRAFRSMLE